MPFLESNNNFRRFYEVHLSNTPFDFTPMILVLKSPQGFPQCPKIEVWTVRNFRVKMMAKSQSDNNEIQINKSLTFNDDHDDDKSQDIQA